MSIIEMINPNKPLVFTGHKTSLCTDEVMIELARKMNNEVFRYVIEPITKDIELSVEDTAKFIKTVIGSNQRKLFDENLQGMAETVKGEPLLTGWLSLSDYQEFLVGVAGCPVSKFLYVASLSWNDLGVEDVYFDGFELNDH